MKMTGSVSRNSIFLATTLGAITLAAHISSRYLLSSFVKSIERLENIDLDDDDDYPDDE